MRRRRRLRLRSKPRAHERASVRIRSRRAIDDVLTRRSERAFGAGDATHRGASMYEVAWSYNGGTLLLY